MLFLATVVISRELCVYIIQELRPSSSFFGLYQFEAYLRATRGLRFFGTRICSPLRGISQLLRTSLIIFHS